jgi:4-alpha-glucanotransferase
MTDFSRGRHAGVLLPLFSCPSTRSWGIGEIGDMRPLCRWLQEAGFDILQLLPVNAMASGDNSPYSATSAMAIDPIFISVWAVEDFVALGGEQALDEAARAALADVRLSGRVEYATVRRLKEQALSASFERFLGEEWSRDTPRAGRLRAFIAGQASWLDDYALYAALRRHHGFAPWWEWADGLRRRQAEALESARREHAREVLYAQYLQWIADVQWHVAREACRPVGLFGDLAFMVAADSADVWAEQHAFLLDATVGVPPDAFSPTGQDWGLPVYRWDVLEAEDYGWIRRRAARTADLFDGYRVDHLVGLYRTYVLPGDGSPHYFTPADEADQLALGERLLQVYAEPGARIIAEDLGTVPDFVRESLDRLEVSGYRVLRWEREWNLPGQPFRDPAEYPPHSVATTGTHDTETLVAWWEGADAEERAALLEIPSLATRGLDAHDASCTVEVRDAILDTLLGSASDFVLLPMQDVFGWRERVNTPATVGDDNWTYRLPWPVDHVDEQAEAAERAVKLRAWVAMHRRSRDLFEGLEDARTA